ncbi:MAG: GNAT family N-acetyltransferase [Dermatophilus congolensis]|nr:GNAT family N-acetyltransferase [Dermatophilus congolensis]
MSVTQGQLVELSRAEAEDAFALAALELQRAREQGRPGQDGFIDKYADFWLGDRQHRPAWIAKQLDGRPLGALILDVRLSMPSPGQRSRAVAVIDTLFVNPAHRRQGTGERLVRAALIWCTQAGVTAVHVAPTPLSSSLLGRLGFSPADAEIAIVKLR